MIKDRLRYLSLCFVLVLIFTVFVDIARVYAYDFTEFPDPATINPQYPYVYICTHADGYRMYVMDYAPIYDGSVILLKDGTNTILYKMYEYGISTDSQTLSGWYDDYGIVSTTGVNLGFGDKAVYSNFDILDNDGSVFFSLRTPPVSVVAQGIPGTVMEQTIVPVGVGILLISLMLSLGLLPKLLRLCGVHW
jgi:hypothetical protein